MVFEQGHVPANAGAKKERKPLTEGGLLSRVFKTTAKLSPESRKALKAFLDVDVAKTV